MRHNPKRKRILFIKSYPKIPLKNGAGLRQLETLSLLQQSGYDCHMIYILPFHQWIYFKKEMQTIKNIKITYQNFPLKSFYFSHNNIKIDCYFYGHSQEIIPGKFYLIFKYLLITKRPAVVCTHIIDILTILSCSETKHTKLVLFVQDTEFLKPGNFEQLICYYYPASTANSYILSARKELFFSKLRRVHLLCISKTLAKRVEKFSVHKPFVMKYFLNRSRIVSTNSNRKYIGFINPTLEKGLGILIQIAMAMPDRKFLVVGDAGPATDVLKEIFSILGNVIWQPFDPDIKRFWAKIRIFLTPSFWGEGFHRVVLEAMVNGIPVLATDQAEIKEVLNNTGFTFNIGYQLDQTPAKSVKSKNIDILPWMTKIEELDSSDYYTSIADECRIAAEDYLNSIESNQKELIQWFDRITG